MSDVFLKKRQRKKIAIAVSFIISCFIVLSYIGKRKKNVSELREEKEYKSPEKKDTLYERQIKRMIDKGLSFIGLVLLAPVYGMIALAIFIDDPGPVLFTQKRVGKYKEFFMLHKFRSMKMSTPHDVPTHQLKNPEQYITRVGKFLRKYSLDELPQIWDIFVGNMSIIGPRPALWNQDDLVAERDKYGANDILPGLTGWAQINGRDELEITDKAKLDGEYAEKQRQGGMKALLFDVKCFLGTIKSVSCSDGVVEGGTGEIHRKTGCIDAGSNCGQESSNTASEEDGSDAGFADYGYLKHFEIDTSEKNKKRVLVTGAGSYIGESFECWAKEYYPANFTIDTLDMQDQDWREKDFSSYDAVLHVAGIAHVDVGKVSEEEKKRYYAVNTDLAIETAKKAKAEGVRQFVFMSSMIVYGDPAPYGKAKIVDEHTVPAPANFYGDSKWQADKGVRKLADEKFRVAVLRPPMIYGKGSKGNYSVLVKLAKRLPVFPDVENRRSMLYIDNLCEFLCKLILSGEGGVYFPQNGEYTRTSGMVGEIAETAGKKIWVTKLLRPAVAAGSHVPGKVSVLVGKAFGNSTYSQKISRYEGLEYQGANLKAPIKKTERKRAGKKGSTNAVPDTGKSVADSIPVCQKGKKRVLILVNHDVVIYNFRLELVEKLLAGGYEVHISSPEGDHTQELLGLGVHFHKINIDRHGMDPKADLQVFGEYRKLIKRIRPIVLLTYTVKPNVYGGMAAQMGHIPYIANVTGLGTTVNRGGIKEKLVLFLYRLGLNGARKVFFQNESDRDFMLKKHVAPKSCPCEVIPGSGVNLERHRFEAYPNEEGKIVFTTVGRIMRDKGTDELLCAAKWVKKKYPAAVFRLIGFFDDDYEEKIRKAGKKGIIEYFGQQKDIHPWLKDTHAVIHPSYHEGMSNVLLEAAATGRPVLASDIPGCKETFDESVSGIGFTPQDSKALMQAIEQFINLPHGQKAAMGKAGREKMEREFDRGIVVGKYMQEICKLG